MADEERKEFDLIEEYTSWGKDYRKKVLEDDVLNNCFSDLNKNLAEFLWHGYWNEVCEYLQKSA